MDSIRLSRPPSAPLDFSGWEEQTASAGLPLFSSGGNQDDEWDVDVDDEPDVTPSVTLVREKWRGAKMRVQSAAILSGAAGRTGTLENVDGEGTSSVLGGADDAPKRHVSNRWKVAVKRVSMANTKKPESKPSTKDRWKDVLSGLGSMNGDSEARNDGEDEDDVGGRLRNPMSPLFLKHATTAAARGEAVRMPRRMGSALPSVLPSVDRGADQHWCQNNFASIVESIPMVHSSEASVSDFLTSGEASLAERPRPGRCSWLRRLLLAARAAPVACGLRALSVLLSLLTLSLLLLQDHYQGGADWCQSETPVGCQLLAKCASAASALSALASVLLELCFGPRLWRRFWLPASSPKDTSVAMLAFALAASSCTAEELKQALQRHEITMVERLLPLARVLLGAKADGAEKLVRAFLDDPRATEMEHWTDGDESSTGIPAEPDTHLVIPSGKPSLVRAGTSLAMALQAASTHPMDSQSQLRPALKGCADMQEDPKSVRFNLEIAGPGKSPLKRAATGAVVKRQDSSASGLSETSFSDFNQKQKTFSFNVMKPSQTAPKKVMEISPARNGNPKLIPAPGMSNDATLPSGKISLRIEGREELGLDCLDEDDAATYHSGAMLAETKLCGTQMMAFDTNGELDGEAFRIEFGSRCMHTQNVWLAHQLQAMQRELQAAKEKMQHTQNVHQDQIEILRGFRKIITRTFDDWSACPVEVYLFEDRKELIRELEDICKLLELPFHSCTDTVKGQAVLQDMAAKMEKEKEVASKKKGAGELTAAVPSDNIKVQGPVGETPTKVVLLGAIFLPLLPSQWTVSDNLFVALVSEAEEFEELGKTLFAHDEQDVRRQLKNRGIDEYLLYPVSQSAVEDMVRGALHRQFGAEYLLVKPLGRGTMGVVYNAKRVSDGETFALKEINIRKYNKQGQGDMLRQLESMQVLIWPTLVSLLDYWMVTKDKLMYCLMPVLSGGSLERHIEIAREEDGSPIRDEQVQEWYAQTLHGLSFMHWHGIIHRDIKPDNLLTDGDKGSLLKIGDMGSMMSLPGPGPHPAPSNFTQASVTTPSYSGPEAHVKQMYYSGSDIWSVGATFYEVVTLESLLPIVDAYAPDQEIARLVVSFDPSSLGMTSQKGGGILRDLPELLKQEPEKRPSAANLAARKSTAKVLKASLRDKYSVTADHFDTMKKVSAASREAYLSANSNFASSVKFPSEDRSEEDQEKRCPSCGSRYMEDSNFCRKCGLKRQGGLLFPRGSNTLHPTAGSTDRYLYGSGSPAWPPGGGSQQLGSSYGPPGSARVVHSMGSNPSITTLSDSLNQTTQKPGHLTSQGSINFTEHL